MFKILFATLIALAIFTSSALARSTDRALEDIISAEANLQSPSASSEYLASL